VLVGERAKVVSGVTVSTPQADIENGARYRRRRVTGKPGKIAARRPSGSARRASVIRQNFRNGRCKVIYACTGHDDAVAPAVSFLRDAQEFPAIILAELHVKMLPLNLQFFRFDNVIHHSRSRRLYGTRFTQGKKNPRFFAQFPAWSAFAFPIRAQTPLCGRDIALRAKQKAATRRSVTADYEFMAFFDFSLLSSHFWRFTSRRRRSSRSLRSG